MAREVAERLSGPVVVTPVVRGGLSTHHLAFPGTVTVPPDAYRALVVSYLEGLERMGIGKIALFSWHGGNFGFVREFVDGWQGEAQARRLRRSEALHRADDGSRSGEAGCTCRRQTYTPAGSRQA